MQGRPHPPEVCASTTQVLARKLGLTLLMVVLLFAASPNANAQFGPTGSANGYPTDAYYQALAIYRSGDLPLANKAFEAALGQTRRDINGRWIDAIPVYAMMAECQYQLGDVVTAREHLDAVYQLAVRHRGWLSRPDWQSAMSAGADQARAVGLWPEATAVNRLPIARRIQFLAGKMITEGDFAISGPMAEPLNSKVIDVVEIMRGLAIASYRRRMILGPLSQQDPLTREALDATKYPASLRVPIGKSLIGAMRGTELFANHDDEQSIANAVNYGGFSNGVHPLSTLSLLTQASALAGSKKPEMALPVAARVVNVAAANGQFEYVGEAMQLAAGCASKEQATVIRATSEKIVGPLLRESRLAALHVILAGADAAITAGQLEAASVMLQQGKSLASRRDVMQPRLNAYAAYLAARLSAARGESVGISNPSSVDVAISEMTGFTLNRKNRSRPLISMPRVYQLELIRRAVGKQIGGQSSDKLLDAYCSGAPAVLWRRDPVDALTAVMLDRTVPHLARLEIAASGKRGLEVLARTDELLSHRFQRRLALGGRITQIRALARTPDRLLGKEALAFRNNAPKTIKALRAEVAGPPVGDKSELIARSARLESMATQIALSRVEIPSIMLPPLQPKTAVASLPPRTGLLTFVNVENRLYATLAAEGKVEFWMVRGANRLPSEISRVLRGIGVGKVRGKRLPEDDAWRKDAVTLRRHLLPDDATVSVERFDKLVIVPDNALWYVPFELLPLEDEASALMGDKIQIRYAATPGLAFQPTAPRSTVRKLAVANDKFFAPRDLEKNEQIVEEIADSVQESVRVPRDLNVPSSLIANSAGHFLVAAPVTVDSRNPFATNLAGYDRATPAGTLAAWMRFPAVNPESVVLPGYRSAADGAQLASGEEIFFTVCALQSSGVRNVLISRWIVGGESTSIALKEFLQELPFSGMPSSWDRARAVLRKSELNPTLEPMLTKAEHETENLTGDQPFFWAGYIVAAPFDAAELNQPAKLKP